MESGRLVQDTGHMRFASSARSTDKVQLGIPQTASTPVFYATLSLSIFPFRFKQFYSRFSALPLGLLSWWNVGDPGQNRPERRRIPG